MFLSVGGHGWPSGLSLVTVRVTLITGLASPTRWAGRTVCLAGSQPCRAVLEQLICTISCLRSRGGLAIWGGARLIKSVADALICQARAQAPRGFWLGNRRYRRSRDCWVVICHSRRAKRGKAVAPRFIRFWCNERAAPHLRDLEPALA